MNWTLHPRLQQDSLPITDLHVCTVRLLDDSRFPWVLLVPKIAEATSWFSLDDKTQQDVMNELNQVAAVMERLFAPTRLNVGMIGNMVEQLHIHCVARHTDDEAWPGVVWGHGKPAPHDKNKADDLCHRIASGLHGGTAPD